MTLRPRVLVFLSGLIPTLVAAIFCVSRPPLLAGAELGVYDRLVRSLPTRPRSGRVVIVDVDERSLTTIGQWPWRRDVMGTLIERLRALDAETVALDIVFAEADRDQQRAPSPDEALAATLAGGRVVLGYALTFDGSTAPPAGCVQHPLGLTVVRGPGTQTDDPFFRATGAVCNLRLLTTAAGASGFLNAAPDPDGLLRRVPLVMEFEGRAHPSLAVAAVTRATGRRGATLRVANVNTALLGLEGASRGPVHVPIDGKSNLLVRYRGVKHTFPYVSAADVLSGAVDRAAFAGKIVFVGTTALGTREVVATPLDTLFAGVEVQATVADNLLQGDFFHRPEHGIALEAQLVLGLGIAATLLVLHTGLTWGALGALVGVAALWIASRALLSGSGMVMSPLYPTLGLAGAMSAMTVARVAVERRRADRAGQERATSQRLMVQTLLSLTEIRDAETGRHSRRTREYARLLAEQLATYATFRDYLTPERMELLSSLAPLHDIGKVGIPDRLLNKPGELTRAELEEMRQHPRYGRDVIEKAQREAGVHDDLTLTIAKDIVYTHHERWDGTGYPQGLRGNAIPIPGRIMALVDVYDAVVSRRLYKAPLSHDDAVALIARGRGTHFDPEVADAFLHVAARFAELSSEANQPTAA